MDPWSVCTRRRFLQFGTIALGNLSLAAWAHKGGGRARARSCILLYMDGGPSHIDLWDMKPAAPEEVRGPFRPIATSVPGIHVCEHLPRVSRQMHRLAQVRGVRHGEGIHDPAVYQMLTGRKHPISAGGLTVQPNDFPQVGTVLGNLNRQPAGMPRVIEVPETMKMDARVLPGQSAGFLGASWDPFRVQVKADGQVVPPEWARRSDLAPDRLTRRASLLETVNARYTAFESQAGSTRLDQFQEQALALLSRPEFRLAFDLEREPSAIRDWYGRNRHGQSVLLARRLVEAGSSFVTVYWGKEWQDWGPARGRVLANNPWDTHLNHFPLVSAELLPRADRALAALVEDLHQRGLLSQTLVVWMGDFGRTPRIDRRTASRDHWPAANTVLLAGATVRGGLVHGRTNPIGAEVIENAVSPADLTATLLHLFGVNPRDTLRDAQGRPYTICEGDPITALLT
jgi:hypothetical protein